jgi:phosphate transport system substrate-binding protein
VSSLADRPELVGFFSYSREDDEAFKGTLSALRDAIQRELGAQLGRSKRDFRLWQDKEAIAPGRLWETEIRNAVEQAVFFIPIVTPRMVNSKYCQFEFDAFIAREQELGRSDLVFPILYISVAGLDDEPRWRNDPVLSVIGKRQYVDWRPYRHLDMHSTAVREAVERFSSKIVEALHRSWLAPEEKSRKELAEAEARAQEELRRQEAEAKRNVELEARKHAEAAAKRSADERRQREIEANKRDTGEHNKQVEAARERDDEGRTAATDPKGQAIEERAFANARAADSISTSADGVRSQLPQRAWPVSRRTLVIGGTIAGIGALGGIAILSEKKENPDTASGLNEPQTGQSSPQPGQLPSQSGPLPQFSPTAGEFSGAGSTFPYAIYAKWAAAYKKETGVGLNYQSIGSGAGIKQIEAQTVDFGATDVPLSAGDLEKNGLVQFPMVIGGIVPIVNLDGIGPDELVLDGPTLAKIYLGDIKMWNDTAIKQLNPGVTLPEQDIATVHRSDGSAETFNFTCYLSRVSTDWYSKVGYALAVEWQTGLGAKGNEGVANNVAQTKGSIGYVEYGFALQDKLTYTKLINKDGKTVAPTSDTLQAAAANTDWNSLAGYGLILANQSGTSSWPITGATYILIPKRPHDAAAAETALSFFAWAYANGGEMAEGLGYAPVPQTVVASIEAMWVEEIKDSSGNPLETTSK